MTHKINDNGIDREMTADEETEHLAWVAKKQAAALAEADAQTAKETAREAVLDKLGLTADEVAALLG